jgi:hypothetical protein
MNDFTKDELIQLSHLVSSVPLDDVLLLYKIQSMIDNYCEHKNTYEDLDYNPTRCKDCKEIVE